MGAETSVKMGKQWKTENDWERDWALSCFRQGAPSDAEMYGSFPGCADSMAVADLY